LIQTTPPDLRLRRADIRRAYSLKMAASLACARALKMISSGKNFPCMRINRSPFNSERNLPPKWMDAVLFAACSIAYGFTP